MSDISKVFRPADILGFLQAIKGFDKSDFWEVLNNLRPADLNPIYKILKFHIASSNPNFFGYLQRFALGTKYKTLKKPKFILLAEALCSQASSKFWAT
jgi:hypothetical protein